MLVGADWSDRRRIALRVLVSIATASSCDSRASARLSAATAASPFASPGVPPAGSTIADWPSYPTWCDFGSRSAQPAFSVAVPLVSTSNASTLTATATSTAALGYHA